MFAYIKGIFVSQETDAIVVECGGIGYRIFTADRLVPRFGQVGDEIVVYTQQVVREDDISLYGFPTKEGRQMFSLLLAVSGIGPRVATQIMGTLDPDRFALAVLRADIKTITTVKGLGKKGAERLVLELKDKFKGLDQSVAVTSPDFDSGWAEGREDDRSEVRSALMVLGFSYDDSERLVKQSYQEEQSLQENIRMALRAVGK